MDEIATSEANSLTIEKKLQAIAQQSEENFNESEIFSTIATLEEGLRVVVNEVQGLQSDMEDVQKDTEDLKKCMDKCFKLANTEWSQRDFG